MSTPEPSPSGHDVGHVPVLLFGDSTEYPATNMSSVLGQDDINALESKYDFPEGF